MEAIERKKKLSKVNLELERLLNIDRQLIAKKRLFEDKINLAVKVKKLTQGIAKEKIGQFEVKFLEHRLKVGAKRIEYYKRRKELLGPTKAVKVDDSNLDAMINKY